MNGRWPFNQRLNGNGRRRSDAARRRQARRAQETERRTDGRTDAFWTPATVSGLDQTAWHSTTLPSPSTGFFKMIFFLISVGVEINTSLVELAQIWVLDLRGDEISAAVRTTH